MVLKQNHKMLFMLMYQNYRLRLIQHHQLKIHLLNHNEYLKHQCPQLDSVHVHQHSFHLLK